MARASSTAPAGTGSRTKCFSAGQAVPMRGTWHWRRERYCRFPARVTWPCSSVRRTSIERSARARSGGFRWRAAPVATCSMASWTPIGFQAPTTLPSFETPAVAVRGRWSSRPGTSSMKHAPRGRFACRPMGVASPSSRAPDCLPPNRRDRSRSSTDPAASPHCLETGRGSVGVDTVGQRSLVYGDQRR